MNPGQHVVAFCSHSGIVLRSRNDVNTFILDYQIDELVWSIESRRAMSFDELRERGLNAEVVFQHQRPARRCDGLLRYLASELADPPLQTFRHYVGVPSARSSWSHIRPLREPHDFLIDRLKRRTDAFINAHLQRTFVEA